MLVATRCRRLLRLGVFQASPNNQRMERGQRNDGKYHLISASCYLFILSAKLRSSALVVCTVDRGEQCWGCPHRSQRQPCIGVAGLAFVRAASSTAALVFSRFA